MLTRKYYDFSIDNNVNKFNIKKNADENRQRRRWTIWLSGGLSSRYPKGYPGVKNFSVLNLLRNQHDHL